MHSKDWIPEFHSCFKQELEDFIKFKRSNGYVYGNPICYRLKELDTFLCSLNMETPYINQEIYDLWLMQCKAPNSNTKARYSSAMITFCEYLRMTGHENVIQPDAQSFIREDYIPYIFSDEEIKRILDILVAKVKEDPDNWDNITFYILFCLYYACGLRKSEALNLRIKDFSTEKREITIMDGKNNVSRHIPLSDSMYDQFNKYVIKNKYENDESYVFSDSNNKRYGERKLYDTYHQLLKDAKIPVRHDGKRQRIHDLRHLFAVKALKQMEEKGFDLYTSLPLLSTYMGHKHLTETEYYIRLVQDEAEKASKRAREYLSKLYDQEKDLYEE